MCYILFTIVLSVSCVVHSDWVQIAQTTNVFPEQKNYLSIDRSHLLATLNVKNDFIVDGTTPKIDTMRAFNRFSIYPNQLEMDTNFFGPSSTFNFSAKNVDVNNMTIDSIQDSWPVLSSDTKEDYFDGMTLSTTDSSLINVTDASREHILTKPTFKIASDQLSAENKKKFVSRTQIILKRLEYKPFDFQSVFDFLKNMQKTFLSTSLSAIDDKVKFLENSKENILNSIGRLALKSCAGGNKYLFILRF